MSLVDGQVLDGKYVITRRLAEGGMSTVFLGVNQRIGKQVAVKVLHPAVAREEDVVQRFEREARIVSRIRSPFVADVYDFGTLDDGARFMVMEYLEGESLAAMIERERTIPARSLSTMALQILEGLSAAHSVGIVHRDLKPENVIVTKRHRDVVVKLVDFGISKVVDGAGPFAGTRESIFPEAKATAAGAVLGTPLYMSPEQARGQTALIDRRTDLYSLGVMLYEATAGEPPLMGDNVNDLLFRVALDEPMPLSEKVPNVDRGFAAIVMKALAKDVTQRWQTADEMKDAIEAWRTQFVSGAQSVVPSTPPANVRNESLAVATPMSIVTPTPTRRVTPVGIFARARRYAVAIPAAAMLLLLIPAAKRALHQPDDARPLIETTAATIGTSTSMTEPLLPEPVTTPPPLAITEPAIEPTSEPTSEPAKIEPAKAEATVSPLPLPKPRWTAPPPRKKAPPPPVMDAGTEMPSDPVAAATPTVTEPTTETPNVIVLPPADDSTPPDPQPTQEN